MIKIDLFSDVICPWCFIGKRRFEKAVLQRPNIKTQIEWQAFQLNPNMPISGMSRKDYIEAKFGGSARAKLVFNNIARAGESEGIKFSFEKIQRTPNTTSAHRLIAWANVLDRGNIMVENLFRAYFFEGQDIGNINILSEIARDTGLDSKEAKMYLESSFGIAEITSQTQLAYSKGITGVPCFIFNGKYSISGAQVSEAFLPFFDLDQDTYYNL